RVDEGPPPPQVAPHAVPPEEQHLPQRALRRARRVQVEKTVPSRAQARATVGKGRPPQIPVDDHLAALPENDQIPSTEGSVREVHHDLRSVRKGRLHAPTMDGQRSRPAGAQHGQRGVYQVRGKLGRGGHQKVNPLRARGGGKTIRPGGGSTLTRRRSCRSPQRATPLSSGSKGKDPSPSGFSRTRV